MPEHHREDDQITPRTKISMGLILTIAGLFLSLTSMGGGAFAYFNGIVNDKFTAQQQQITSINQNLLAITAQLNKIEGKVDVVIDTSATTARLLMRDSSPMARRMGH